MKRSLLFGVFLALGGLAPAPAQAESPTEKTIVVPAINRPGEWNGWGLAAPPAPASAPAIPHAPAKFVAVENSRTFSGRIEGLRSTDGAEVGVISLVGVHWVNPACYQWQPISPDGTFSITSEAFPDAAKTIAVRGPQMPWTFLEHDFPAGTGAKEIVIPADPGRKVRFTVGSDEKTPLAEGTFDVFAANRQFDNRGTPLRRQHFGQARSGEATSVEMWLPSEPVAVLVGKPGFARNYPTIDPRDADHFHFVLQRGGTLKITVLDADGNPRPGVEVKWVNPTAPLSLANGSTDPKGILRRDSLAPGPTVVHIDGQPDQVVTLVSGQESELVIKAQPAAQTE